MSFDRRFPAIETRYNGYRFRSRLEARWAVFFDALGVAYEYEKEGLSLPSGPYLPDFWMQSWECWLEIKPGGTVLSEHADLAKWREAAQGTRGLIVLAGSPWPYEHAAYLVDPRPELELIWPRSAFGECRRCGHGVAIGDNDAGASIVSGECCPEVMERYPLLGEDSRRVMLAYERARSARFEHGERP